MKAVSPTLPGNQPRNSEEILPCSPRMNNMKMVSPTLRTSLRGPGSAGRIELRPIDGEFKHSTAARAKWCRENGHPQAFLNLSLSAKDKQSREHYQCLCGSVKSTLPESRPGFPPGEARGAEGLNKKEID